jgi:beta-lactamase class A
MTVLRPINALLVLVVALNFTPLGRADGLEDRLAPLAKAHEGTVAIAVKRLTTGESYYLNADEAKTTASLIKLPVMIETYYQVHEGKVKLTDPVTLRKADMVGGSGILNYHFSDGATFPLRDAVHLMIVYSDNTATNLVLDKIGIASTGERMEKLDLPNTKIHSKVSRRDTSIALERSKKYGLGSTTAREMIIVLERLHKNEFVSPEACKEMLDHLRKCEDKDKFPRFLPEKVVIAHKTGSLDAARTDAGLIYLSKDDPVAVCVLTSGNKDHSWRPDNAGNLLCAKVAKAVYDYFSEKK